MKFALALISLAVSTVASAGSLHCVSNSHQSGQIIVQGQISQGNVLAVNFSDRAGTQNMEILVKHIKPSNEFVEINGIAKNRMFVGGGQLKVQLILPFKEVTPATLRTVTPVFNQEPAVQEIQMLCRIQNLYQIPPNVPVLATM